MKRRLEASFAWAWMTVAAVVALSVLLSVSSAAQGSKLPPRPLLGAGPDPDTWAAAFFDDSIVHDVRLAINTRDWEALKESFLDNTYYPADLRWGDLVVRNVGIRSRGTGSRSGTKPGLRVDLDRYTDNQRFLGLESFVLRNQTQDPSALHERIAMAFFRRLGLASPREAHARLFINDQYAGLYSIVESIDRRFMDRTYGEDEGYLYEYSFPVNAPAYRFEYRGPDSSLYVPLPFDPETHENNPRSEVIAEFIDVINNASDATFRTQIDEYTDLTAFVRRVAAEQFLAEDDGILGDLGMNNFYFYRPPDTKRFEFISWDKSNAFVGGWRRSIWHNVNVPAEEQNRLLARAMASPDLVRVYYDTLLESVQLASEPPADNPAGAGWLEREIEREYAQVRDAARTDPVAPYTAEEFEAGVEELREFARLRGANVLSEIPASAGGTGPGIRPRSLSVPRSRSVPR
jgi:hypothetical protein